MGWALLGVWCIYTYLIAGGLCGIYIVLLGVLGHWGSETQRWSDLVKASKLACGWAGREPSASPGASLSTSVMSSPAWIGRRAPHAAPLTASLTATSAGGLWDHPSLGQQPLLRIMIQSGSSQHFLRKIFFIVQCPLRISLPITSLISTILTKCFCFFLSLCKTHLSMSCITVVFILWILLGL